MFGMIIANYISTEQLTVHSAVLKSTGWRKKWGHRPSYLK